MKRMTRLKYTGVVIGAGLSVILLGGGAYANTRQIDARYVSVQEEKKDIEKDVEKNTDQETAPSASALSEENDDVKFSAGAGLVFEDGESMVSEDAFTPETDLVYEDAASRIESNIFSAGVGLAFEGIALEEESGGLSARSIISEHEAAKPQETYWGYTNLGIAHVDNHLNIREKPSEDGKLVGKLSKDAACEILAVENGWANIKSGKVEGYCSTEFLYMGEEAIARGREAASMIAVVNTQTLKVREEPNTECAVITLIPQDEELEVVEVMENGWIKFLLDDEEAYVSGEFVDVEERLEKAVTLTELLYGQGVSNVRVDLVQYAKQFIGNPYVWGGASLTKGADCSGFTLSIFKKYGVSLPHHAASQAQLGTKINLSEAQPGDLVFYAKNGRINHVAIYIGGGQVIHASSPKTGIKISSVNYRTVAGVRRFL